MYIYIYRGRFRGGGGPGGPDPPLSFQTCMKPQDTYRDKL